MCKNLKVRITCELKTMPARRRSVNPSNLKFRPSTNDVGNEPRGTKPTSTPTSVKEILILMVLHICRKSLFFNINLKVALYLGALFLISLIADMVTFPKGYFSRSNNVLNQYFVKLAWGWNLVLIVPYVFLTSYTYCCGKVESIIKHHITRILVATAFWLFWVNSFNYIEAKFGRCNIKGPQLDSKPACLKAGHVWMGFDISGHAFILIYGSLMVMEEGKSMTNWDGIKEYIRLEIHQRRAQPQTTSINPLRLLSEHDLNNLSTSYEKYTPYIRALFVAITLLQLLWDLMLVTTMLYYHIMIEKFLGGACAVLTWYFTYRVWFKSASVFPKLPGEGAFKYIKSKTGGTMPAGRRRTGSIVGETPGQLPRFMGMPLYGLRAENGSATNGQEDIGLNR